MWGTRPLDASSLLSKIRGSRRTHLYLEQFNLLRSQAGKLLGDSQGHQRIRRVLRAGAYAQKRTGAVIWVHPGRNEMAPIEEVEALADAGANLSRVVVCHIDRCGYLLSTRQKLLDSGCYLEYDFFGWEGYYPARVALAEGHLPDILNDVGRIKEIKELIGMGYLKQILLSQDIHCKTMLVSYGGWGYAHLLREVVPLMKIYGISDEQINTMMVENPKRVLSFAPVKE